MKETTSKMLKFKCRILMMPSRLAIGVATINCAILFFFSFQNREIKANLTQKLRISSSPETDKMGQFLGPVSAIIGRRNFFPDPRYKDKKKRHVRFLCHLLE